MTTSHSGDRHSAGHHALDLDERGDGGLAPIEWREDGENIWSWSATRTAAAIRTGDISAAEALASISARIDAVDPAINAFVERYGDEGRANAAAIDAIVAVKGEPGPLGGVPVAIKDNTFSAGHRATDGVEALADVIYPHDDPVVERIRRAGGNIIGRTNLPPHCWQLFSTNTLNGETRNPRNPALTPGGSSGGAAAALAAGMIQIAQGNDIGGSIRYPAYACGVVGLRPTVGTVPGSDPRPLIVKPFPFQAFAVQGPLARTVDDVALAFHAFRGYSPRDGFSTPPLDAPLGAHRVALVRGEGITPLDPQVAAALDDAAGALAGAGYEVEEVDADRLFRRLRDLTHRLVFEQVLRQWPEQIPEGGEILRRGIIGAKLLSERLFGAGYELTLQDYLDGLALRGELIVELQELLERFPLILTPVSSQPPFARNEDQWAGDERRLEMADVIWPMESIPIAEVPALAVPTGHVWNGVPLGVQLIARRFAENDLFEAGRIVQARQRV